MVGESIEFTILYYDFRMINGTFTVKTKKLKKLFPHTEGMMTKLYTPNQRWDVNTLAVVSD